MHVWQTKLPRLGNIGEVGECLHSALQRKEGSSGRGLEERRHHEVTENRPRVPPARHRQSDMKPREGRREGGRAVACGPHISGFVANQITASVVAKEGRGEEGFSKVVFLLSSCLQ